MRAGTIQWDSFIRKRNEREYKDSLPHFVYFIENQSGQMKIGVTENLERRFKQLQHANGEELNIFCFVRLPNKTKAISFEFFFHDYFCDYRIRGEWFDGNEIKKAISGELGKVICFEH